MTATLNTAAGIIYSLQLRDGQNIVVFSCILDVPAENWSMLLSDTTMTICGVTVIRHGNTLTVSTMPNKYAAAVVVAAITLDSSFDESIHTIVAYCKKHYDNDIICERISLTREFWATVASWIGHCGNHGNCMMHVDGMIIGQVNPHSREIAICAPITVDKWKLTRKPSDPLAGTTGAIEIGERCPSRAYPVTFCGEPRWAARPAEHYVKIYPPFAGYLTNN
jgi:hypothetical protein